MMTTPADRQVAHRRGDHDTKPDRYCALCAENRTTGQVGTFVPDFAQDASQERRRLIRMTLGAERAGYENVAQELRELDSELFDVTDDAPTIWRAGYERSK